MHRRAEHKGTTSIDKRLTSRDNALAFRLVERDQNGKISYFCNNDASFLPRLP
jgi:hypothetical protein